MLRSAERNPLPDTPPKVAIQGLAEGHDIAETISFKNDDSITGKQGSPQIQAMCNSANL